MRKFIIHIILFSLLCFSFITISLIFSSNIVKNREFKNYETESNTLFLNENVNYDILIMGISHARMLSRHRNHLKIERILNKSIVNIGQGKGRCSINEQLFYLKYFYAEGNRADTILLVMSPPMMFSENLAISSNTFIDECFSLKFFTSYLFFNSENKFQRISEYITTKYNRNWITMMPFSKKVMNKTLIKADDEAIEKGLRDAYYGGDEIRFQQSCSVVENIILLALKQHSKIIFIVPPTVFGEWPEHKKIIVFSEKMKNKYGIQYYDFTDSIPELKFYYDHHHLNTNGVIHFTESCLKPVFIQNN